ncbi:MAG: RNA polymerase II mediator complex subunit [Alectoria sarmentosa]|nr:MAG: RNA polymerase II mediator complex subunit [Alectoria sarmentosa]
MPDNSIDDRLKDVIQNLFEIQSAVHGYLGPETQQQLVRKIHQLTTSLSTLSTSSSALPISLPPEIIDYIDQGRNPDIYTRELVEAVQRSNQYLKGKSEAFAGFRDILAEEMIKGIPDCKGDVERILAGNDLVVGEAARQNGDV